MKKLLALLLLSSTVYAANQTVVNPYNNGRLQLIGQGGGGGSTNGNVVASPQFQVGVYSGSGSTTTITGSSDITAQSGVGVIISTLTVSSQTITGSEIVNGALTVNGTGILVNTIFLPNVTNNGTITLQNAGTSGLAQLLLTVNNGVGINTPAVNGVDLSVRNIVVSTITASSATVNGPISINQTNTGIVNAEVIVSTGQGIPLKIIPQGFIAGGVQQRQGAITIGDDNPLRPGNAYLVFVDSIADAQVGYGIMEFWMDNPLRNDPTIWNHGSQHNSGPFIRDDSGAPNWEFNSTSSDSVHGRGKFEIAAVPYQSEILQVNSRAWDGTTYENIAYWEPLDIQQGYATPGLFLRSQDLTNDSAINISSNTSGINFFTTNGHTEGWTGPLNIASGSWRLRMPATIPVSGQILSVGGADVFGDYPTSWIAAPSGGSSALGVNYNGVSITTPTPQINFVGAGVVVTNVGSTATVTISGASSGSGAQFTDQLLDCQITNPTSSTLVFASSASATHPCTVRFGESTYQFVSSSTLTLGASTGTVRVYVTNSSDGAGAGSVQAAWSAGSGLTGSGINVQTNNSQNAAGSIPLGQWNATVAGTWDATGVNVRAFLSGSKPITAGSGITITENATSINVAFNGIVSASPNSTYGLYISTPGGIALLSVSTTGIVNVNGAVAISTSGYLIQISNSNLAPWTTGFTMDYYYNMVSSGNITSLYGVKASTAVFPAFNVTLTSVTVTGASGITSPSYNFTAGNNQAILFVNGNAIANSSNLKWNGSSVIVLGGVTATTMTVNGGQLQVIGSTVNTSIAVMSTTTTGGFGLAISTRATLNVYNSSTTFGPTITNGTSDASCSNAACTITATGSPVVMTFTAGAYINTPVCLFDESGDSLVNSFTKAVTNASVTITQTSLSGTVLNIVCIGRDK